MKHSKSALVFIAGIVCLTLCALASVAYGSKVVGFHSILAAFSRTDAPTFEVSVVLARVPRTVFGIVAGAALGVSGALMQAITRNPIADPSILGVNTGASLFVVFGIAFLHITSRAQYIWLAFAGAALAALFVYGMASAGHGGPTPAKLALAGAATTTALSSLVNTIMLPSSHVMDSFRFWQTGSISGTGWGDIAAVLPYLLVGFVMALALSPALNALALGDEIATSLGVNTRLVRAASAFAGVLLCAATTALAGPIGFVGLMIPHLMRLLLGPDMRLVIPMSALGGGSLLLLADILGRILGRPGEVEVGIITAILGAPAFIFIVRKAKVRAI